MQAFEEHACFKMPTLILVIVGAAMLLLSACISFFQSLAATELDPDSRDLLALAHARSACIFRVPILPLRSKSHASRLFIMLAAASAGPAFRCGF